MGQRHQVYVRLPNKKVIGIHHQWLYGRTALESLNRFLTFLSKTNKYCPIRGDYGDPQRVLEALYSVDANTGYFHRVHDISDESSIEDPRLGDNNDGITIIDLTGVTVRYCFMILEGKGALKAMDAEKYYRLYYPIKPDLELSDETKERAAALISSLSKTKLLTTAAVKGIFPAMYKKNDNE